MNKNSVIKFFAGLFLIGSSILLINEQLQRKKSLEKERIEEQEARARHIAMQPLIREAQKHRENEVYAKLFNLLGQLNEKRMEQAILDRRVLKQMSPYQVLQARGYPDRIKTGDEISDDIRRDGCVEIWIWGFGNGKDNYIVAFGINQTVIASTSDD
jgi:hypothetical protein